MRDISQISDFIDEIESNHDVEKRLSEINNILSCFKECYKREYDVDISYSENASIYITYFYFFLIDKELKSYLDQNSNIFKMSSATEQTINYVQPIITESSASKSVRTLNAELASYAAVSFITGWNKIEYDLNSGVGPLNDAIDKFLTERIKILEYQNLENGLPILFNSQSWELFHLIHQYYRSIAILN